MVEKDFISSYPMAIMSKRLNISNRVAISRSRNGGDVILS
jgi:hypothetical protein